MSVHVHPEDAHQQAARELLASLRLAPAEVDARAASAMDPGYWRALVPGCALEGAASTALDAPSHASAEADTCGRAALSAPAGPAPTGGDASPPAAGGALPSAPDLPVREVAARFAEEGYFVLPSLLPAALVDGMRSAVTAVEAAGWPAVFAWVYDAFWQVPRMSPVADVVSAVLAPGSVQTANIWTHVVPGQRGALGWAPHVDHHGPDTRLTLWVALTDATVDTGCLCVLPRHRVPQDLAGRWAERSTWTKREALDVLHAARPLPAAAGSVLGWDASLLHWGAAREVAGAPRISYSMEFATSGATGAALAAAPAPAATPTTAVVAGSAGTAAAELPPFADRLRAIARGIANYHGSEPRATRFVELAERLRERLARV